MCLETPFWLKFGAKSQSKINKNVLFLEKNKQKSLSVQIKFVLLQQKTNKSMDIRERIEQVINEKGLTKKVVAERMGKFNQAFNSLLTNPKWNTIELVASAIGITTQEMLFGIKPEAEPAVQQAPVVEPSGDDELPFSDDKPAEQEQAQQAEEVKAVRFQYGCPHCGHQVTVTIE